MLALIAGVIAVTSPLSLWADHDLLANGRFDDGITGWIVEGDPIVALVWDGSVGNPRPGSLALSTDGTAAGSAEALGECFEPPPGTRFEVRSLVLAETSDGAVWCRPFITQYTGPGCTGFRSALGSGGVLPTNELGIWSARSFEAGVSASEPSFRVSLFFWHHRGSRPASCRFDSVELFEPGTEAVVEVPALDGLGLLLLVAALGLSAVWVLRRQ